MLRSGLGPSHPLIVAIVIVALFGSKELPEAARGLGKCMRILKSETKALKEDGVTQSSAPPAEDAPVVRVPPVVQAAQGDTVTGLAGSRESHGPLTLCAVALA
ncbi:Sec-independent protein translocase subunit TatA [Streptomyces sp. A1136]|uniref:Sec-independent protein translocase subunit TatA n=1 Tax=Streptomyces sp. A1136 TaxID=2563102 RepID=UPI00109EC360|nr:Sec-independent protein translocase subunit TatA [Streptomyces sp. A1136]THA49968.1 Sec-independent protein translocase subunit TatA [Streptomyces sp. A1136]